MQMKNVNDERPANAQTMDANATATMLYNGKSEMVFAKRNELARYAPESRSAVNVFLDSIRNGAAEKHIMPK